MVNTVLRFRRYQRASSLLSLLRCSERLFSTLNVLKVECTKFTASVTRDVEHRDEISAPLPIFSIVCLLFLYFPPLLTNGSISSPLLSITCEELLTITSNMATYGVTGLQRAPWTHKPGSWGVQRNSSCHSGLLGTYLLSWKAYEHKRNSSVDLNIWIQNTSR